MISLLEGTIADRTTGTVVVLCGGVGYGVYVCSDEWQQLTPGTVQRIYVSEVIREDLHDLYGFCNASRRELFEKLLSVNGIGPKAALALIELGTEAEVRTAIAHGDIKKLTQASGVGRKGAERVVLDLRSKVGINPGGQPLVQEGVMPDEQDDAVLALVALGFNLADAQTALLKIDTTLPVKERVRIALKG